MDETLLEVTPQPSEIEIDNSVDIDITTDADDYEIESDNQYVSFNEESRDTNSFPDTLIAKVKVTAVTEGNTHITIKATAQGKNEKIVEWDLEVQPKQDTQPTDPTPPTDKPNDEPILPTFKLPLELDNKRYIDSNGDIVIFSSDYLPKQRLVSGEIQDIVGGLVFTQAPYSYESSKNKKYFLVETGEEVVRAESYVESPFKKVDNKIIDIDNQFINVYKKHITYLDYAIVAEEATKNETDAQDTKDVLSNKKIGKETILRDFYMKSIELNAKELMIIIDETLKLSLKSEAKFNQVKNFLLETQKNRKGNSLIEIPKDLPIDEENTDIPNDFTIELVVK